MVPAVGGSGKRSLPGQKPILFGASFLFEAAVGLWKAAADIPTISLALAAVSRSTSLAEISRINGEGSRTGTLLRFGAGTIVVLQGWRFGECDGRAGREDSDGQN